MHTNRGLSGDTLGSRRPRRPRPRVCLEDGAACACVAAVDPPSPVLGRITKSVLCVIPDHDGTSARMAPADSATTGMDLFDRWRTFRSRFERRLRRVVGRDRLVRDVLLHEVDDECLHIDYVLPAGRRVLFVDLLEYGGRVFGAETLRQWTILDRGGRHVLDNPLFALQAKKEAMRNLLRGVGDSDGYLVFPENTVIGRDIPGNVVTADVFFDRLEGGVTEGGGEASLASRWDEIVGRLEMSRPS